MEWKTYERRNVLEAIRLALAITIVFNSVIITQHKGHFDDARQARGHKGVAKNGVHLSAKLQVLRMGAHGPSRNENDEAGHKVALRTPASRSAEPHTRKAGTPPDDAHGGVL